MKNAIRFYITPTLMLANFTVLDIEMTASKCPKLPELLGVENG